MKTKKINNHYDKKGIENNALGFAVANGFPVSQFTTIPNLLRPHASSLQASGLGCQPISLISLLNSVNYKSYDIWSTTCKYSKKLIKTDLN